MPLTCKELSIKAGVYDDMRKGVRGFIVNRTRTSHEGNIQPALDSQLKGVVFYWDVVHPDGQTGHKVMGEIMAQVRM
jgi:hypothetical protein